MDPGDWPLWLWAQVELNQTYETSSVWPQQHQEYIIEQRLMENNKYLALRTVRTVIFHASIF